jgi:cytochrome oxidase Cu insertion factor (SCO1/SenC/PrrC family)/thiol-disulfide isomerase/thioredoxin
MVCARLAGIHARRPRLSAAAAILAITLLGIGCHAPVARADGDPGSDVLVFQNLFVTPDAGLSVTEQAQLGDLLQAAQRAGMPVRIAVIANRFDLGSVTALWREPRAYARFLGIELSLAYSGRLLVVMPNGLGFNWPGHPAAAAYQSLAGIQIEHGGAGLFDAARAGVRALAAAAGVKLPVGSTPATQGSAGGAASVAGGSGTTASDQGADTRAALVAIVVLMLAGLIVAARRIRWGRLRLSMRSRRARRGAGGVAALVAIAAVAAILLVLGGTQASGPSQSEALAFNPDLDPGTSISASAPGFTLSNQFGQPVSLRSFRGKVVILAFNDSECTTVCPLTTTAMLDAKAMLGGAASEVQLLGVDANPAATSLEDVWSYSELHGMLHSWDFLTGALPELRAVWKAYGVEAAVQHGEISHTPALFVIDRQGREAKVYLTQQSYSAVGQLGQILAHEVSSLLPDHPPVRSDLSYARIPAIPPTTSVELARAGGGSVMLGPGPRPRLFVFFATWDRGITSLGPELDALNGYASGAAHGGLPALTAVDEASVEPSPDALSSFLHGLPQRLSYPVALDRSGRVADGYEVQGEPWFVLTSPSGQILWYWQVSTSGWLSRPALTTQLRAALARAPRAAAGGATSAQELAGSPAPLAELHRQAAQLLGSQSALAARIRSLHGYPIVINAWASWCAPCRSEFALFANASTLYGRRVAFLGADTDDSAGDARSFLAQHPVSYPSYQTSTSSLSSLAVIEGLPTTIFIDPAGKVVYVHTGQYDSQGTLDSDIESHAIPAK